MISTKQKSKSAERAGEKLRNGEIGDICNRCEVEQAIETLEKPIEMRDLRERES